MPVLEKKTQLYSYNLHKIQHEHFSDKWNKFDIR